jgi:hypothetical protein
MTFSGMVGSVEMTDETISWVSETSTNAVFEFTFDYQPDPSDPSNVIQDAAGTLTFNKGAGTYTVALDEPIESFGVPTTSGAQSFTGYQVGTSLVDNTQPDVSVAQLAGDFFSSPESRTRRRNEWKQSSGTRADH